MNLFCEGVTLRSMEPDDVEYLYKWENDTLLWNVCDSVSPFSREALRLFIESSLQECPHDQLRLMIDFEGITVGCIDLFDISNVNHHASLGILIYDRQFKRKGIASRAICLLEELAFKSLEIRSLKAEVSSDNVTAINFFRKLGYEERGILLNWKRKECDVYTDVHIFQHNISSK